MAKKFVISVEEIESYIKYIKKYKRESSDNKRRMDNKLQTVHGLWDDINYTRTIQVMDEVGKQLEKLYVSLDETTKTLTQMTQAYNDYLNRRK